MEFLFRVPSQNGRYLTHGIAAGCQQSLYAVLESHGSPYFRIGPLASVRMSVLSLDCRQRFGSDAHAAVLHLDEHCVAFLARRDRNGAALGDVFGGVVQLNTPKRVHSVGMVHGPLGGFDHGADVTHSLAAKPGGTIDALCRQWW